MSDSGVPPRPLNGFFAFRTLSHYALQLQNPSPKSVRNRSNPDKQIDAPLFLSAHPAVARKIALCFKQTKQTVKPGQRQGTFSKVCGAAWKCFLDKGRHPAFDKLVKDAVEEHGKKYPGYIYSPARRGEKKARRARAIPAVPCTSASSSASSSSSSSSSSSAESSPAPASPLTPLDELEDSFPEYEEQDMDVYSPQMDWTATGSPGITFISHQHAYAPAPQKQIVVATPSIDITAPWSPEAQVSVWGALGERKAVDEDFSFPPLEGTAGDDAAGWTYDAYLF